MQTYKASYQYSKALFLKIDFPIKLRKLLFYIASAKVVRTFSQFQIHSRVLAILLTSDSCYTLHINANFKL